MVPVARLIAISAAISAAASAHAQSTDPFDDLAQAVFYHMAGTYLCRDALGGLAQYQSARTIAIESLAPYIGRKEAVLSVDEMDRKFKADPLSNASDIDPLACAERVNESRYAIGVAKARMVD